MGTWPGPPFRVQRQAGRPHLVRIPPTSPEPRLPPAAVPARIPVRCQQGANRFVKRHGHAGSRYRNTRGGLLGIANGPSDRT